MSGMETSSGCDSRFTLRHEPFGRHILRAHPFLYQGVAAQLQHEGALALFVFPEHDYVVCVVAYPSGLHGYAVGQDQEKIGKEEYHHRLI